jgi:threonine dehydrogenase-like Zn-dependent dehydrogenase
MIGNFFLGNGKFEVREMTFGEPGPHEVFVKNMACGICGTDVHIYHGEKGSADVTPPVVLGHEFSGEVVAIGSEVTAVKVGDCVTVDPNMYCGKCYHCRKGQKQFCDTMIAVAINRATLNFASVNVHYILLFDIDFNSGFCILFRKRNGAIALFM